MLYAAFGAISQRGMMLLVTIIITAYLGAETLGGYAVVISNVLLFNGLGVLAITPVVNQTVARYQNHDELGNRLGVLLWISLLIGLAAFYLMCYYGGFIATNVYKEPLLAEALVYSSLSIFFVVMNAFFYGVLSGLQKFKLVSVANVFTGLVSSVFLLFGVFYLGIEGVAFAIVGAHGLIFFGLLIVFIRLLIERHVEVVFFFELRYLSLITSFSLPTFLVGIAQGAVNWVCIYLIVEYSKGLSDVAVYYILNQMYSVLIFIPNICASVLLPYLTRAGEDGVASLSKTYFIASFLAFTFLSIMTPVIIGLYGEALNGMAFALIVTFFTGVIVSSKSPLEQNLMAQARGWDIFKINAVFSVAFLGLAILLLESGYGVTGLVIARMVGYFIFAALCWLYIRDGFFKVKVDG